jgi:hypothetical protein
MLAAPRRQICSKEVCVQSTMIQLLQPYVRAVILRAVGTQYSFLLRRAQNVCCSLKSEGAHLHSSHSRQFVTVPAASHLRAVLKTPGTYLHASPISRVYLVDRDRMRPVSPSSQSRAPMAFLRKASLRRPQ